MHPLCFLFQYASEDSDFVVLRLYLASLQINDLPELLKWVWPSKDLANDFRSGLLQWVLERFDWHVALCLVGNLLEYAGSVPRLVNVLRLLIVTLLFQQLSVWHHFLWSRELNVRMSSYMMSTWWSVYCETRRVLAGFMQTLCFVLLLLLALSSHS